MPRFDPPMPVPQLLHTYAEAKAYVHQVWAKAKADPYFWPVCDSEGIRDDKQSSDNSNEIDGRLFIPVMITITDPELMDRVAIEIDTEPKRQLFEDFFGDPDITTCWHNYGFDYLSATNLGIRILNKIGDTILFDWMYDAEGRANRHSIDHISEDEFGIALPKFKQLFGNKDVMPPGMLKPTNRISDYPFDISGDYGSSDTWRGAMVMKKRRAQLENTILDNPEDLGPIRTLMDKYWIIEEPHMKTLLDMELRGTLIDVPYMEDLRQKLEDEAAQAEVDLFKALGRSINVGSAPQMQQLLFDELGFVPSKKTRSGAWSTDAETREDCAHQAELMVAGGLITPDDARFVIMKSIQRKTDADKHRSTFVEGILSKLDAQNRIHTHYNILIRTNRLSSQNPNLQNLPNPEYDPWETRRAWIAPEGEVLLVADWSQIELVILAAYTQDAALMEDVVQKRDLHSSAAARAIEMDYDVFLTAKEEGTVVLEDAGLTAGQLRQGMKTARFAEVYGAEGPGLAKQMSKAMKKPVTVEEAEEFQRVLSEGSPRAAEWKEEVKAYAREAGYVQTILGHRRKVVGINSDRQHERKRAERVAVNTTIQGSAADMMKIVLLTVDRDPVLRKLGFRLLLQVHDEIVGSCPIQHAEEIRARVVEIMTHPFRPLGLRFPLPLRCTAELVNTWFEGK